MKERFQEADNLCLAGLFGCMQDARLLANHKLGWHGNVAPLMDGTATPRPSTAPPRIKPEGEAIASVSRGKRMRVIVHEFGQHGPSPRKPRVKVEAKATADVAKGGRMYSLLHKYGTMPLSARAVPRVKPEAEGIATVSKGKRMENLIHKYGRNEVTPRMPPRVKPEANDNAQLDRGFRMATLVHSFQLPVSARRVPRVKPEAAASAQLDQGFRMSKLLHESHTLPSMSPGDNTLNAMMAMEMLKSMNRVDPELTKPEDEVRSSVLEDYVKFMTTPGTHNDTYAESFHRAFFKDWAAVEPHPTAAQELTQFAEKRNAHKSEKECAKAAADFIRLTHPVASLIPFVDTYARLLHAARTVTEEQRLEHCSEQPPPPAGERRFRPN
nr:hypothetical protein BaRGS_022009 [Batillaria attramentaria]